MEQADKLKLQIQEFIAANGGKVRESFAYEDEGERHYEYYLTFEDGSELNADELRDMLIEMS